MSKKVRIFAVLIVALGCSGAYADCLDSIDAAQVASRLAEISQSYGDVPSAVACAAPATAVEKLICASPVLQAMELLDTRSYVYAAENATGNALEHAFFRDDDWIRNVRDACTTADCLCAAFKNHTADSLGESPYGAAP